MDEIQELPGFFLCKIGGRPPKTGRDIAIWMARNNRISIHGDLVKDADAFILDHWKSGVTESAHIRRIIKRVDESLGDYYSIFSEHFCYSLQQPIKKDSIGWIWLSTTKEAQKVVAGDLDMCSFWVDFENRN
jgi:hypothetical protein